MCIEPCYLPKQQTFVACRYCWQCRRNRINDLVGRCIAEQKTSTQTLAVTLTYRGDVVNASTLIYSDFQKFMKRLRRAGYSVRYIVAGEYGSKKGRAHWHAILFFSGKSPEFPLDTRVEWDAWPHGFAYFQEPDYKGFAYVLKYVLKDQDAEVSRSHLAMSKKPPLGHDFMIQLAEQYVQQKLSPQNAFYSFRDVFDAKGKRRRFFLQGRMREIFIEHFIARYQEVHGTEYPYSEFLELQEDKWARGEFTLTDEEWRDRLANRVFVTQDEPEPEEVDEQTGEVVQPVTVSSYVVLDHDNIAVRYSDGSIELQFGKEAPWRVESAAELDAALRSSNRSYMNNPKLRRLRDGLKKPPLSNPQPRPAGFGSNGGFSSINQSLGARNGRSANQNQEPAKQSRTALKRF
ncbi:rolling circle replication-associated protein [Marinovum sp. E06]|uniref:rolling circle replication-associated protein n=1 Tax=Marinovum sp. E06 TaxID=3449225 RepID=UPI003EDB6BE4